MAREIRKVKRTAEERQRLKAEREYFQKNKTTLEELVASGEYEGPFPAEVFTMLRQAVYAVKQAREDAGMALAKVEELTGIDKTAISRLENGRQMNPTLETLARIALALGKRLEVRFVDDESEKPTEPARPAATV